MTTARRAAPPPRVLKDVLPPPLFDALRFYVAALETAGGLVWEDWGRRHIRHNDPFAALVHRAVHPLVETAVGRAVKPSYSFVACYADGGRVPRHTDRAQCRFTLDLCLDDGGRAWPLYVADQPYVFGPNEALLYPGCDLEHHRRTKPKGQRAHLVFFHFVDAAYNGPLD